MFVSDALPRLHTEAEEEGMHDMITPTSLQHLNTAHIYHNFTHFAYN